MPWVSISKPQYNITGRNCLFVRYQYKSNMEDYICWVGENQNSSWSYNWQENNWWQKIKHGISKDAAMKVVDNYFIGDDWKLLDQRLVSLL
jgi:hypothetical protein